MNKIGVNVLEPNTLDNHVLKGRGKTYNEQQIEALPWTICAELGKRYDSLKKLNKGQQCRSDSNYECACSLEHDPLIPKGENIVKKIIINCQLRS